MCIENFQNSMFKCQNMFKILHSSIYVPMSHSSLSSPFPSIIHDIQTRETANPPLPDPFLLASFLFISLEKNTVTRLNLTWCSIARIGLLLVLNEPKSMVVWRNKYVCFKVAVVERPVFLRCWRNVELPFCIMNGLMLHENLVIGGLKKTKIFTLKPMMVDDYKEKILRYWKEEKYKKILIKVDCTYNNYHFFICFVIL